MPPLTISEFRKVYAYIDKAAALTAANEQYVAVSAAVEAAIKNPQTLDESSLAMLQNDIDTAMDSLAAAWNLIGNKDQWQQREKEAFVIENPVNGVLKKVGDRRDEVRETIGKLRGQERDVQLVLLRSEMKALHTAKQYRDDPQLSDTLDKEDPVAWWNRVAKALEDDFKRDKAQMEAAIKNEKQGKGKYKIKDYIAALHTLKARLERASKAQKQAAPQPVPKAAPKSLMPPPFHLPQGSPGIGAVGPGVKPQGFAVLGASAAVSEAIQPGTVTYAKPRLPTAAELAALQATMASSGVKGPQY